MFFLHDNACSNVTNLTKSEIQGFGWEALQHPPFAPDGLLPFSVALQLCEITQAKTRWFVQESMYRFVEHWQEVVNNDGEYIIVRFDRIVDIKYELKYENMC